MAWFVRAIEQSNRRWRCQFGRESFDDHSTLHEALRHLVVIARSKAPAQIFVHFLDGSVRGLGDVCTLSSPDAVVADLTNRLDLLEPGVDRGA